MVELVAALIISHHALSPIYNSFIGFYTLRVFSKKNFIQPKSWSYQITSTLLGKPQTPLIWPATLRKREKGFFDLMGKFSDCSIPQ